MSDERCANTFLAGPELVFTCLLDEDHVGAHRSTGDGVVLEVDDKPRKIGRWSAEWEDPILCRAHLHAGPFCELGVGHNGNHVATMSAFRNDISLAEPVLVSWDDRP